MDSLVSSERLVNRLPALGRQLGKWLPLALILAAWNLQQIPRIVQPMSAGHDARISRHIGRHALIHLVWGLKTTRGANVRSIDHTGRPVVHTTYAPLLSWTLTIPLALGVPFHPAIRMTALLLMNLFFLGLFFFLFALSGRLGATAGVAVAAATPMLLYKYSLACMQEFAALAPLIWALALLARPLRCPRLWFVTGSLSIAAVMCTWFCWVPLGMCFLREWFSGRRRPAVLLAIAVTAIPAGIHLAAILSAGGDIGSFFRHGMEHISSQGVPTGSITQLQIAGLFIRRIIGLIGVVPAAFMIGAAVALAAARPLPRTDIFWFLALLSLSVPVNLFFRTTAWWHDYFVVLAIPFAALSVALAGRRLAQAIGDRRAAIALLAVFLAYFVAEVYPKQSLAAVTPYDRYLESVVDAIGEAVRPSDFVIGNAQFRWDRSSREKVGPVDHPKKREAVPVAVYGGKMTQTYFIAYDTTEAEYLAHLAAPDQRVVIIQLGPTPWPVPRGFVVQAGTPKGLLIARRDPPVPPALPASPPD